MRVYLYRAMDDVVGLHALSVPIYRMQRTVYNGGVQTQLRSTLLLRLAQKFELDFSIVPTLPY